MNTTRTTKPRPRHGPNKQGTQTCAPRITSPGRCASVRTLIFCHGGRCAAVRILNTTFPDFGQNTGVFAQFKVRNPDFLHAQLRTFICFWEALEFPKSRRKEGRCAGLRTLNWTEMKLSKLKIEMRRRGLSMRRKHDGALAITGNLQFLSPELKDAIREHKPRLEQRLLRDHALDEKTKPSAGSFDSEIVDEMERFFDRSLRGKLHGSVSLSSSIYEFYEWDGEQLRGNLISFDTETA